MQAEGAYDDKLMLWNPGELPQVWTVAKPKGEHSSGPFNSFVANALLRAGEIEAWGRGIQRIFAACREVEVSEPRVLYEPGDMWFESPFSAAYLGTIRAGAGKRGDKVGEKVGEKLGERLGEKLGETRTAILKAMQDDPKITGVKLAKLLGMSTTAVEKNIEYLKSPGHVKRHGPAKGGYWEVLG